MKKSPDPYRDGVPRSNCAMDISRLPVPACLNAITDVVLAYQPKAKRKKPRKRKKAKR